MSETSQIIFFVAADLLSIFILLKFSYPFRDALKRIFQVWVDIYKALFPKTEPQITYPPCRVKHEIACLELNIYGRIRDPSVLAHLKTCQDRYAIRTEQGEWRLLANPKPLNPAPVLYNSSTWSALL